MLTFNFAPGIKFETINKKYLKYKLDYESWINAVKGKIPVIVGSSGLVEDYFALSLSKAISESSGLKTLMVGNQFINNPIDLDLSNDKLKKYTSPIFFDEEKKYIFFNRNLNYIEYNTTRGKFGFYDKRSIFEQMWRNTLIDWNIKYLYKPMVSVEDFLKINKLHKNDNILLLCVDIKSNHEDVFKWNVSDVRNFCSIACKDYKIILLTNNIGKYYGLPVTLANFTVNNLLIAIKASTIVVSENYDIGVISALQDKVIISRIFKNHLSYSKAEKFLRLKFDIGYIQDLTVDSVLEQVT